MQSSELSGFRKTEQALMNSLQCPNHVTKLHNPSHVKRDFEGEKDNQQNQESRLVAASPN